MADPSSPAGNPNTALLEQVVSSELDKRGVGGGGGGGHSGGLDGRVAKLEAHTEHMQSDVTEIRGLLGDLVKHVHQLPTKQDLTANLLGLIVIGLTIIVLAIGGIIGGLGWIQDHGTAPAKEASSPAPMIFQLPAQPVPQAAMPAPTTPKPR